MSKENEGNGQNVAETKKENKPKKELTPQEIQKRKKMLVYPLFVLVFIGIMWLIFAPSGDKDEQQSDGFNSELPIPKDDGIVGDKRTAYEREAMQNKQQQKMRSLQDFSFMLGEEGQSQSGERVDIAPILPDDTDDFDNGAPRGNNAMQSSAYAYQDINRQLNSWNEQPATKVDEQSALALERIEELERKLGEAEEKKNSTNEQLELIEKSYQIASKYMPNTQATQEVQPMQTENVQEKVTPKPVTQVYHGVVSLLAAPMDNDEFMEQYGKPRNMGFITAAGNETVMDKNSIRACVYQTVTISNGKELQLRLLEPMRAGGMLIPANTIMTGSARIGGERLQITINSIQHAENIIPVEMIVYDMDGLQGIFVPNSDEINAAKEIAANMGTSMGSSITITDDAGSQLAADLGRSTIQGVSQYFTKKMREVKVTLKAGYRVLLIPKA